MNLVYEKDATDNFPHLETDRLILREIQKSDAGDLLAIHSDPVAMRWFGSDLIHDLRAAERLVEIFSRWRQNAVGTRWAIERRTDGRFLGTCGLYCWDRTLQRCCIGYELGTYAWGKGWMREALGAVIPWGFTQMHVNRIEAHIHPQNKPSIKLAKNMGFVQEGVLRELEFWGGRHHDMLLFSLLRREGLKSPETPNKTAQPGLGSWIARLRSGWR